MPGFEIAVIGLLASLGFIWRTGVYPGGIIVPSYLALFLYEPQRIAGTMLAALLALAAYRVASRWLILFGRRRFVFLVVAGGVWALLWLESFPYLFPTSVEYRVIGWVIPGLIANQLDRQGVAVTTASLVTVTVAVGWLARLLPLQ